MKNTRWLKIAAALVVVISLVYTFTGNESEVDYQALIAGERAEKDQYFLRGEDSPLTEADKQTFTGLSYFPVNQQYKVMATLEHFDHEELVSMPTSDGKAKDYRKYAIARFTIEEKALQLTLFEPVENKEELIFLPFADETSADETYGAGRYLDFAIPTGDRLEIDFNLAYNPYCAYSDKFSCPLPPRNNYLPVAILAGEKNYSN